MTTDDTERHDRAAAAIATARLAHTPMAPLPDDIRPTDFAEAHAVQDALHARLQAAGMGARVGYKIGCTTQVMQERLEITHPCDGGILAANVYRGPAELRHGDYVKVGVECEIAVLLGADLAPENAPFTQTSVAAAVEACMAAIEIVDSRYADFHAIGVETLIADDFFGAGCVLGDPVGDWRALDLAALEATTLIDGVETGRGRGADVMGHPFAALAWLANDLAGRGRVLKRGEFVLTGSMVAVEYPEPGQTAEVVVNGLGAARARFV